MSLLFGGKPEEVPLRRKILRVLVFAASKASTFLILEPVLQGKHCSALPSARAYVLGPADVDYSDVARRERIQLRRRHLRARAASDSCLRHATRRCRRRREPYYSNPAQTGVGAATWITIGIIVYIALVMFGMPGACPASL